MTLRRIAGLLPWLVLLLALSPAAHAAYTRTLAAQTAFEAPANAWAAGDDTSVTVPIGFTFMFAGQAYTSVSINSNGALSFDAPFTVWTNSTLPVTSPTQLVLPYWDDLDPSAGGSVSYGVIGSTPNRRFVVSWNGVPRYGSSSSCSLQVVLHENQSIRFRYSSANVGCGGNSATVGVQESGTSFSQHSFNSPISLTQDIVYTPTVSMSHRKSLQIVSDPVSATVNPKFIPGAVFRYTLDVTNGGAAPADNNTVVIVDPVPAQVELYTGSLAAGAPFVFANGSPSSGLSCPFVSLASTADCVDFSSNGGASWNYVPNGGYDPAVTHIRFRLSGTMNPATTSPGPNFNLQIQGRVR